MSETHDIGQCVRCGYCCRKSMCGLAYHFGRHHLLDMLEADPNAVCPYLKGDKPGEHWCQLIREDPSLKDHVAIGGGCSSTLFNDDREAALNHLGIKRRPFPLPWISA